MKGRAAALVLFQAGDYKGATLVSAVLLSPLYFVAQGREIVGCGSFNVRNI